MNGEFMTFHNAKKLKFRIKLFLLLFIIYLILYYFSRHTDKVLYDFARTNGANGICELLNACILDVTEKEAAEYNSICKIHYDSAGKITAVSVNAESVNKLKSKTVSAIIHALKDGGGESFNVPLGTLLGSRIFSAKGPAVKIDVIPLGAVSAELVQKFTSVGINQTLHSLYIDVRINVRLASPFSHEDIAVGTSVCVAETVIIGDIPFAFME